MSKTALIIDDELPLREIICEALKLMNIDTIPADGGKQALKIAETLDSLDLIVLDMNMPEMDGEETYQLLSKFFPHTPVIFMSGYDMEEWLEKMDLQNSNCFLKKPFRISDIHQVIKEMI
ncbi:MAG: response regulator [Calditrichae bacterium]|nr:response regulator [Calditrichota bacterium]MCB9057505.1 response regulator [Calditrichia bacterium]